MGLSGAGIISAFLFCRVSPSATPNEQKKLSEINVTPAVASDIIMDTSVVQGEELEKGSPIVHRF